MRNEYGTKSYCCNNRINKRAGIYKNYVSYQATNNDSDNTSGQMLPNPPYCENCAPIPDWPIPGWPYAAIPEWPCLDEICVNRGIQTTSQNIYNNQYSSPVLNTYTDTSISGVNDKTIILREIYRYEQQITDCLLYLDEHPDDNAAIQYYTDLKDKYRYASKMYRKIYGTLENNYATNQIYADWNSIPLPWGNNN